ncbi:uridine kinase [candidate division LCP-89 bacterium B3_LCP]|uniref:Uridine kinase n=1 Tax=candidate division LCP-89 bacterium B3_LCP TaxID=2012998 RepID=A0A532UYT7_UNCL8|nr:MAG: uridine kinase [candidate division LCP-89 bacterium B3_LCP]
MYSANINPNKKGILIGIAGGTGSGKTTAAKNILRGLGSKDVAIVTQDSYYFDLSDLPQSNLRHHNFDHPDAIDRTLLFDHMRTLLSGGMVDQHIYDYSEHCRTGEFRSVGPHTIIVLEGILVLYYPELREMMDIKVFVDTDDDIRLMRRLRRDIQERGRTMEMVLEQYMETVRLMHEQFVIPTKRYADIIIPEGGKKLVAIDLLRTKIKQLLQERGL